MEKKIEDYLHLYLGCDAEFLYKQHFVESAENGNKVIDPDFVREHFEEKKIQKLDKVNFFLWNPAYIKPILRPLSDMTEDEFREVIALKFGVEESDSREVFNQMIFKIQRTREVKQAAKFGTSIPYNAFNKDGKHYMSGTFSQNSINPDQFIFLLSKSFDLFGLIESGLAIDKK